MDERPWHRHYDPEVPPRLDYDEVAVPDLLRRTAERVPKATALLFEGARMRYAELVDQVDRLATALAGLGVEPGARVAIHLPNLPQTVIAYHAALSLGARVVMTNPLYTEHEIEHQWNDAGCSVAVTADYLWETRLRTKRYALAPRAWIVASIPEYLPFPKRLLAPLALRRREPPLWAKVRPEPGVHRFRALVRSTEPRPPRPHLGWDDVAVLQYTGGTTGVSKAAMLTHANLSVNVQQTAAWFTTAERDREVVLAALPLFHVFGMTVAMNWALASGAAMVLLPNPRDSAQLVASVARHRVTIFPGVPAMFNALNHHPGIEDVDVSSVKACFSGSAPLPADVLERFERLTGARILEGYGLTETSPVTHVNPMRGTRKIGTIGMPVSDTDARVVDAEDGRTEVPSGTEGELLLRGPQVMAGYWQRPDETAKTLVDGWLATGDLVTVDADGYFRIVGRKKDMINASGLKVYPDEVDAVLVAHPDVLEAATIGVPHPERGETVKSFVVLRAGKSLTVDALQAWCRESLAPYKVPREVEFLDALPKSTVLKVLRRELREREARRGAAPSPP